MEGEKREGEAAGRAHAHTVEFACGRLEPPPINGAKNPKASARGPTTIIVLRI